MCGQSEHRMGRYKKAKEIYTQLLNRFVQINTSFKLKCINILVSFQFETELSEQMYNFLIL